MANRMWFLFFNVRVPVEDYLDILAVFQLKQDVRIIMPASALSLSVGSTTNWQEKNRKMLIMVLREFQRP